MPIILLVEDDSAISSGLCYALSQEGYEVITAERYDEACAQIQERQFQFAILDITLPDGNGFDLFKHIKQKGDTPIIFLTARDEEVSVVMGLDIGADDYVIKPFRLRELISRVKSVLRRTEAQSSANDKIVLGGIILDTALAKVFKEGKELQLTALEYKLLLTLLTSRGRILSRSVLLRNIWDIDSNFVDDNTLTVHIKRLRDKVEDNPKNPRIIQTVRGLGYRAGD